MPSTRKSPEIGVSVPLQFSVSVSVRVSETDQIEIKGD